MTLASALVSCAVLCTMLGTILRAALRAALSARAHGAHDGGGGSHSHPWGLSAFLVSGLVSGLVHDVRTLRAHAGARRALRALRPATADELAVCAADVCCVCLGRVRAQRPSVVLPCAHVFHADCIARWLRTGRPVCPHCLAPVALGARARERAPDADGLSRAAAAAAAAAATTAAAAATADAATGGGGCESEVAAQSASGCVVSAT